MGVEIFEETPALSMKKTASGKMEITTPKATITADQVIAAGDAYQGRLLPNLRKKYVLLRTSMLATEVLSDDIYDQILPSNHAVFEWQNLTNYYTKTADKRLIFGGGDAPLTRNKTEEEKATWKEKETSIQWKKENINALIQRMSGWQLETFKESYQCKVKTGISIFKKNQFSK